MAPHLDFVFTVRGYLSKDTSTLEGIKGGPTRLVIPVTRGFVEGSGLKADILPGGADCALVSSPLIQQCCSCQATRGFLN